MNGILRFFFKFFQLIPAAMKFIKSKGKEQEVIDEICELLSKLENELGDKKFFAGESIGLVDIAANIVALWLDVIQEAVGTKIFTKEAYPKLFKWIDEYMNCSVIKETLPLKADLLVHFAQSGHA